LFPTKVPPRWGFGCRLFVVSYQGAAPLGLWVPFVVVSYRDAALGVRSVFASQRSDRDPSALSIYRQVRYQVSVFQVLARVLANWPEACSLIQHYWNAHRKITERKVVKSRDAGSDGSKATAIALPLLRCFNGVFGAISI